MRTEEDIGDASGDERNNEHRAKWEVMGKGWIFRAAGGPQQFKI